MMNNSTETNLEQGSCWLFSSILFTTAIAVVSLAAFIGNIMVIIVVYETPNLRTSTNYYYVNMAVSDFLGALFTWPVYLTHEIITSTGSLLQGSLATAGCKTGAYVRLLSYLVSILNMLLITVERYIAVEFPLKAISLTRKIRAALLSVTWLIPITFASPHILYFEVEKVGKKVFCRFAWNRFAIMLFYVTTFIIFFIIPLISIIFLYTIIMRTLKKSIKPGSETNDNNSQRKRNRQSQNIMRILKSVVAVFIFCYFLYSVCLTLKLNFPQRFLQDECQLITGFVYFLLPLLSSAVNPFILFSFSTNFRHALHTLCPISLGKFRSRCRIRAVRTYQVNVSIQEQLGNS